MNHLYIIGLAASIASLPTYALAASAPGVGIQGVAPAICSLRTAQPGETSNMTLSAASANQYILAVNQLTDPSTGQLKSSSISISLNAICNHSHTIAIQSKGGGLRLAADDERPGFSNHVDYTVSAVWAGATSSLLTSGMAGQSTPEAVVPRAFKGTLQLRIAIEADGANRLPLLAGVYSDEIVITFKPQI